MYCTQEDLTRRFGERELIDITDHENDGAINVDVLTRGIEDASAEMDGYIGRALPLPLLTIPKVLLPLACDITRYKLYDDQPTEQVIKRYDYAIDFLKSVAKGTVSLGVSSLGESTESNDLAEMQSGGSVFAREKSKDFI